jgi:predicted nuclease of predicted toxin-antitoxin system
MRFLIDECLHVSLTQVARKQGYQADHVAWLGLGGKSDWDLMPRIVAGDFTFVTNNARDFRKLYSKEPIHAGLVILLPQVDPERQRQLFQMLLAELRPDALLVNEVIEIMIVDGAPKMVRYDLPRRS